MSSYSKQLKSQAEKALVDPNFDFIATYHAVSDLRRLAKNTPETLDEQTISSLKELLQSNAFNNARQAYFLFREAAKGLTDIIMPFKPFCFNLLSMSLVPSSSFAQKQFVSTNREGMPRSPAASTAWQSRS